MFTDNTETALATIGAVADILRSSGSDSLVEYTRVARIEPITLVQRSLQHQAYIDDILQSITAIFSGYYLQAVMISANVGSVNTVELLDKLNPRRSPKDSLITTGERYARYKASTEDYHLNLPDFNSLGLEARDRSSRGRSTTMGKDTMKTITEAPSLSIGRMLEVQITDGDASATIPVTVRLMANTLDAETLTHILSADAEDTSAKARWHQWRGGEISFVRDLLLCQDLIEKNRKNLIKDTSGTYESMLDRKSKNRISAMLSGNPSVATVSSVVVIDEQTANAVERSVGGKLKNFRVRERVMGSTNTMLLVIVDTEWERVRIYSKTLEDSTDLSMKQIKAAGKGQGLDVTEVLKAYQLSQAPAF